MSAIYMVLPKPLMGRWSDKANMAHANNGWIPGEGKYAFIAVFTQLFCMSRTVPKRMLRGNNLPPLLTLPQLVSQGRRGGVGQGGVHLLFVEPLVKILLL